MEIICVPVIVAIVYVLVEAYKKWLAKGREKWLNVIPVIAVILGGVLGAVFFYVAPQLIVATNIWVALVVGVCSGLSATGTNQIFKQLKKYGIEVKEFEAKDDDK
jgi:hypothetical protein